MKASLDRTGQRIVGVLLEKELSVPDIYPLSENALQAGCNQLSNREPAMSLESFQIHGALQQLMEQEWVARVEGAARVAKYRHRIDDRLRLDLAQKAILTELLVRGPQAPGALKPRVARLGFHAASPEAVETVLRAMAGRPEPLVAQLPRQPRERDQRWRHLLGAMEALAELAEAQPEMAAPSRAAAVSSAAPAPDVPGLPDRVAFLEREVAALRVRLEQLERPPVLGD